MSHFTFERRGPLLDVRPVMPGPGPYYTCLVDMREVDTFPAAFALYFSTDHEDGDGGIWLYLTDELPSIAGAWRSYDEALAAGQFDHLEARPAGNPIFRDSVQGEGHTETPHANVVDGTVYLTYHKNRIENTQRTLLATSPDGVRFERIHGDDDSVVLRYAPGERPGNGHTGYFRWAPNPFPAIPQRFVGYSLHGGGDAFYSAMWSSQDAVSWEIVEVFQPKEGHAIPADEMILTWHEMDPASITALGDGEFVGLCGGGNRASGAVARTVELYEVYMAADGKTLTRECRKVLANRPGEADAEEVVSPTSLLVDGTRHLVYVGASEAGTRNTILGAVARFEPEALRGEPLTVADRVRHFAR